MRRPSGGLRGERHARAWPCRTTACVDLVSLRTSLPVVKQVAKPDERPPTIVNNYYGPVFNAAVHGAQLAWNNNNAIQQQTNEDGSRT